MEKQCRFCGRPVKHGDICDYCSELLCEICGERLSRGYCSVCGRLVCDEDSRMVGFARICIDCINENPNLLSYDYLKRRYFDLSSLNVEPVEFRRVFAFGHRDVFCGDSIYVHIGLDDLDSPYGMCTTYAGAVLVSELSQFGVEFMDYPLLIRLNPNIPFKTRGNAAVAIRIRTSPEVYEKLKNVVFTALKDLAHIFFRKTQPGVVFYVSDEYKLDRLLNSIYVDALRGIVTIKGLKKQLNQIRVGYIEIYSISNDMGRGAIGAISAIGSALDDYTFELLAYRRYGRLNENRYIDVDSVVKMDKKLWPYVFDSLDGNRMLIAPTGPDPVLFGIRGEYPEKLIEAFDMTRHEDISLWCIFRTNQATGSHIKPVSSLKDAYPYETVMVRVIVDSVHRLNDKVVLNAIAENTPIVAYIYKIQRPLQSIAMKLKKGDKIIIVIAITSKNNGVIEGNLEEFIPLELSEEIVYRNPPCPVCCARLKKKGKNEMYCRKCHFRFKGIFKIAIKKHDRDIHTKRRYLPPPRAHRHLTLPNERIYFRAKKIMEKEKPYLINKFFGREKIPMESIVATKRIDEPRIT